MTDPLDCGGTNGTGGTGQEKQGVTRSHPAVGPWDQWDRSHPAVPLVPPPGAKVGPDFSNEINGGPTGPTGPTANDVPDVVRAVLAAFEPVDDPRTRLDAARARVARLADPDGVARSPEGIEAVWDEAEALAAVLAEAADAAGITPADLTAAIQDDDHD